MKLIDYSEIYDAGLAKDAILHTHEPLINDSFAWNKDYGLFRVMDTRIAYAIRL